MISIVRNAREAIRVVLPHSWPLPTVCFLYMFFDVILYMGNFPRQRGLPPLGNPLGSGLLVLAAILYGLYRGVFFHPFYRTEYREWLSQSPWTSRDRLPNGPVAIVWQDLLLLSIGTGLMYRSDDINPIVVPVCFLCAWLVVQVPALMVTGYGWAAFLILMLLGGVDRFCQDLWVAGGCLISAYLIAWTTLHQSLSRLQDWDLGWLEASGLGNPTSEKFMEAAKERQYGWPFSMMSLRPPEARISLLTGLAISILLGWAVHIWYFHHPPWRAANDVVAYRLTLFFPMTFLTIGRLAKYMQGYWPPISFAGRVLTGRWFIPKYDVIFLPPLLIFMTYWFGSDILTRMNVLRTTGNQILIGLMTFIALTMPPSLKAWRLTGAHRISPTTSLNKAQHVETQ